MQTRPEARLSTSLVDLVAACKLVESAFQPPALAQIITGPVCPAQMPTSDQEWRDYIR
ncbi:hypothetical protein [Novosphingobium sp. ERN07]|uniref:hypothetical protein n=1 Tax=Novosphingobium sp. ERN07 TaxID=2726187 RepID=UPI0014566E5D|nr:hypothetical protein [Novosphingobium sp. ERN07]